MFSTFLTERHEFVNRTYRCNGRGRLLLTETLSFDDLTKHDVFVVKMRSQRGGDEELGSVGIGAGVGHR